MNTTWSKKSVIRAHKDPMFFGDIYLYHYVVTTVDGVERVGIVGKSEVTELKQEDTYQPAPTMTLRPADAQLFMDELWNVGIRPSEGTGSAGSLAATERHLADMRALVFKQTPKA